MKHSLKLVALVMLVATAACGGPNEGAASSSGPGVAWEESLPAALQRAASEGKLVMVDFYTDWCGWCDTMDKTTFADGRVQEALKGFVSVKLNAEGDGRKDAMRFGIRSYPTVVFLDSRGREVSRIPGYFPPAPFLEELSDLLRRT